jgi:hypothetical protein
MTITCTWADGKDIYISERDALLPLSDHLVELGIQLTRHSSNARTALALEVIAPNYNQCSERSSHTHLIRDIVEE